MVRNFVLFAVAVLLSMPAQAASQARRCELLRHKAAIAPAPAAAPTIFANFTGAPMTAQSCSVRVATFVKSCTASCDGAMRAACLAACNGSFKTRVAQQCAALASSP